MEIVQAKARQLEKKTSVKSVWAERSPPNVKFWRSLLRRECKVYFNLLIEEGQKVTFTGEGDQAPGIIPGDIVIVIEEKPHPFFKRTGQDLYCEVKIDLVTALCGGHVLVPHLDDRVLD